MWQLVDCLKCLGEGGSAAVEEGERFIVARQSAADGGWSCKGEADLYSRYHASLVAVAALMDHTYRAHGPVFERAADVLPHWFTPPARPGAEEEPPPVKKKLDKQAKKLLKLQQQLTAMKAAQRDPRAELEAALRAETPTQQPPPQEQPPQLPPDAPRPDEPPQQPADGDAVDVSDSSALVSYRLPVFGASSKVEAAEVASSKAAQEASPTAPPPKAAVESSSEPPSPKHSRPPPMRPPSAPDLLSRILGGAGMLTTLPDALEALEPAASEAEAEVEAAAAGALAGAFGAEAATVAEKCTLAAVCVEVSAADATTVAEECSYCAQPCGCVHGPLCDVDHTHAAAKLKQVEACKASKEMVLQWPLPPQSKEVVALLPVMRRIEVREKVQADKLRQAQMVQKAQMRADAQRRFIDAVGRGGAGASGGGSLSASLGRASEGLLSGSGHGTGLAATPLRASPLARSMPSSMASPAIMAAAPGHPPALTAASSTSRTPGRRGGGAMGVLTSAHARAGHPTYDALATALARPARSRTH